MKEFKIKEFSGNDENGNYTFLSAREVGEDIIREAMRTQDECKAIEKQLRIKTTQEFEGSIMVWTYSNRGRKAQICDHLGKWTVKLYGDLVDYSQFRQHNINTLVHRK